MKLKSFFIPFLLILVGESIFILPFLVTRVFRPTFLSVFDITNFQLGAAFSVYGIVAAISYFFGGPIADRFTPRRLISFSLLSTALGGFVMTSIPSLGTLTFLYGFWGLTTILLFWAAFIKAIRLFWKENEQGKAYGLVDSGRGLFAALMASASVFLMDYILPVPAEQANTVELAEGLSKVILYFSIVTLMCSILIWWFFTDDNRKQTKSERFSFRGVQKIAKKRAVWLNAIIVLCAYVGYKCTDDFSLYASVVLGYNDIEAAHIGTVSFWIRPFAALAAGLLGDRFLHSKLIKACFLILLLCSLSLFGGMANIGFSGLAILTLAISSVGIYGLRGLYFATIAEANVPILYTGSAVGLISVIGYTPDIFFGPLMGYILDAYPGETGHRYLFGILSFFSLIGLLATFLFRKSFKKIDSNNR